MSKKSAKARILQVLLGAAIVFIVAAGWVFWPETADVDGIAPAAGTYDALIRRDTYGVPHVWGATDADPDVRRKAALALGQIGDAASYAALFEALDGRNGFPLRVAGEPPRADRTANEMHRTLEARHDARQDGTVELAQRQPFRAARGTRDRAH